MRGESVNKNTFTVTKKDGPRREGSIIATPDNRSVVFDPVENLEPGTVYIAEINRGATDPVGNPLASTHQWSFVTAEKADAADEDEDDEDEDGHEYEK